MRSRTLHLLALVSPLMTWLPGCGTSGATRKHESAQVQIRYLEKPPRACLRGLRPWPTGDLPPLPAELDESSALYTARLLDELDAYRKWGNYVTAWCVEPKPLKPEDTPLRSFRPETFDECGPAGRAGDGSCMNNPPPSAPGPTVYSARTWYGGWLPVVIP